MIIQLDSHPKLRVNTEPWTDPVKVGLIGLGPIVNRLDPESCIGPSDET